ncbi:hypothetical protein [Nocardia nova]|uniref:hypothetical protein n=1 Tax=Nocardia nova TaxID=37330 RepID=UPI0033CF3AB1
MVERIMYLVVAVLIGTRARAQRRCEPGGRQRWAVPPDPGLIVPATPKVSGERLADDERRELRVLRADARARQLAVLGMAGVVLLAMAYVSWLAGAGDTAPRVPFGVNAWWPQLQTTVQGRFSAGIVMTYNLAAMAFCGSMVIALAIKGEQPSEARSQLGQMLFRQFLTRGTGIAATAAVVLGVLTWISSPGRESTGHNVIADIGAVIAVVLVGGLQTEVLDASRRIGEADIGEQLRNYAERRTHIPATPAEARGWRGRTRVRRIVFVYTPRAVVATVIAVFATQIVQVAVGAVVGGVPRYSGNQVAGAFVLTVLQAGMLVTQCAVMFLTWTRPTRGWSRRGDLVVAAITRAVALSVMVSLSLEYLPDRPVTWAGFLVAWTVNPAVWWCLLAWTRTHRRPAALAWFTAPLWIAINRSLDTTQHRLGRQLTEWHTVR